MIAIPLGRSDPGGTTSSSSVLLLVSRDVLLRSRLCKSLNVMLAGAWICCLCSIIIRSISTPYDVLRTSDSNISHLSRSTATATPKTKQFTNVVCDQNEVERSFWQDVHSITRKILASKPPPPQHRLTPTPISKDAKGLECESSGPATRTRKSRAVIDVEGDCRDGIGCVDRLGMYLEQDHSRIRGVHHLWLLEVFILPAM